MLHSMIIAFSMYSKIPMPRVEWNKKNMHYSLCFFPLVGAVIGLCELGCYYGLQALSVSRVTTAVFMTVIPILISGGIHMDGFLDTVDAKSSFQSMEERLKILKDPHTGAFAVIYAIVYLLITFGLYYEITGEGVLLMAVGYAYERVLSAYSVVTLRKAKKDGTVAAFADAAKQEGKPISVILPIEFEFFICSIIYCMINPVCAGACILAALLVYWYYRNMSYKVFDGITGDMAGYFLQLCELVLLIVVVLTEKCFMG